MRGMLRLMLVMRLKNDEVIARDGGPIVFKGGGAGWMRRTTVKIQPAAPPPK